MRYHALGEIPAKRHVQFRRHDRLLTEEVLGFEGFSGNESILYHLNPPTRVRSVGSFTPIVREEWVPETHVHHHFDTTDVGPAGDVIDGRRLLAFNHDVELAIVKPERGNEAFYRNGGGDEVVFIHEGGGVLESVFGRLPFRAHDYVVIPRHTTYRWLLDPEAPQVWLSCFTPGEIETPNHYRNRYGQLLEHAPFSQRDFHPPAELETRDERGEFELVVRARGGHQRFVLDYHPFDVVGWDGYVYPYTFNVRDFEPIAGRVHLPPPVHQTFKGQNFVICSFCPRMLDWDPEAIPVPYHHSNVQSEEFTYYVEGDFAARSGIGPGSITLHPSGLSHGPQPGRVEASLGKKWAGELAVMCDTFRPLRLTPLAARIDDPGYALSWAAEQLV